MSETPATRERPYGIPPPAFRLSDGTHVGAVWSYPGALFMAAGGYHLHLGTNTWAPGLAAAVDEARLIEWELRVPTDADVEAAARHLSEAGYGVEPSRDGAVAADPWKTRVRVLSPVSRGRWMRHV